MTEARNPELVLPLRVEAATDVAQDIRQFDLVAGDGAELPAFTPGAHVLVQAPNGATRRYSLCGAPQDRGRYSIAVKREAAGRGGSASMVDRLAAGDVLHVSLPRNEFALKEGALSYLFIAGGIGITPIRSMILHLMSTGEAPFKLYYLSREPSMAAYLDELAAPRLRGRVVVHHDHGDPDRSYDLWPLLEKPKGAHLYCCGPKGLMESVRDMTGHWSQSAVHFEDFGVRAPARTVDDTSFVVRMGEAGEPIVVPADATLLETLRAHGHRIPSSCESGTCGSCRMQLLRGDADHRDLVLSDAERATSIMVCVSRSRSPELVIAP